MQLSVPAWLCMIFAFTSPAISALVKIDMNITKDTHTVDTSIGPQDVYKVNGVFPAPTFRATEGDTLEITVRNMFAAPTVNESAHSVQTAIHFHGLNQYGTPWFDGVPAVTQCAMQPGQVFVHRFAARDVGTHWYHPHYGIQRTSGAYGALVIEAKEESLQYDAEEIIMLSDWWNSTEEKMEKGITQVGGFAWIGNGHTLLLNGKKDYSLEVESGKKYRLRLINAASLHYLSLKVAGHNLTVVEVEGTLVQPVSLQQIELSPGQRYSVILTADQPINSYAVKVNDRYRGPTLEEDDILAKGALPALIATIKYQGSNSTAAVVVTNDTDLAPGWELRKLKALQAVSLPNKTKEFIFNVSQQWVEPNGVLAAGKTATSSLRWLFNEKTLYDPTTPYLLQSFYNSTDDTPTTSVQKISIENGDVVDMVFQNGVAGNGVCEQHPMHLHGHKFWVISQGAGTYASQAQEEEEIVSPVARDTVTLFPWSNYALRGQNLTKGTPKSGCGWVKIRFVADNPGVWMLHCHVDFHTVMGMALVLEESSHTLWQAGRKLPSDMTKCGNVTPTLPPTKPPSFYTPGATSAAAVYSAVGSLSSLAVAFTAIAVLEGFCF